MVRVNPNHNHNPSNNQPEQSPSNQSFIVRSESQTYPTKKNITPARVALVTSFPGLVALMASSFVFVSDAIRRFGEELASCYC